MSITFRNLQPTVAAEVSPIDLRQVHDAATLEDYLKVMGTRVRRLRLDRHWSQQQLGAAAEIDRVQAIADRRDDLARLAAPHVLILVQDHAVERLAEERFSEQERLRLGALEQMRQAEQR